MIRDLLRNLDEIRKTSSEEEYEEYCEHILKEAGFGTTLLKRMGADSALGKTLLAAGAAGAVGEGASKLGKSMKAPSAVFENKINYDPNILPAPKLPKIAEDEDDFQQEIRTDLKNQINKIDTDEKRRFGIYEAVPAILGAAALGLAVADAVKYKDIKHPLGPIGEGLRGGVAQVGKKNSIIRALQNVLKVGNKAVKRKDEARNVAEAAAAAVGAGPGFASGLAGASPASTAGVPGGDYESRLRNIAEAVARDQTKETLKGYGINDKIPSLPARLIKGVAQGTAVGAGSFLVQSLADEYFRRKDQDELRQILRKSMPAGSSTGDEKNKTPKQVAQKVIVNDILRNGRQINKAAGIKEDSEAVDLLLQRAKGMRRVENHVRKVKQTAAAARAEAMKNGKIVDYMLNRQNNVLHAKFKHQVKPVKIFGQNEAANEWSTKKLQKLHDVSRTKEFKDNIPRTIKSSLLNAVVPATAGVIINRDLTSTYTPLRDKSGKSMQPGKIVVDVPLEKSAGLKILTTPGGRKESQALVNRLKASGKDTGWRALRALFWAAPTAAVAGVTGRNIRRNFDKIDSDKKGPVPAGMARVTIETGKNYNNSSNDANMMSVASEENSFEKSIRQDSPAEQSRKQAKKIQDLQDMLLSQGVKKKEKMQAANA